MIVVEIAVEFSSDNKNIKRKVRRLRRMPYLGYCRLPYDLEGPRPDLN